MLTTLIASAALFGASVSALGGAVVVNKCSYPVYLSDVPAAGGGQVESDKTLQTGDTWSQTWTELTNGQGWSIKLSKDTSLSQIMQYEYTYHTYTPDVIWFDLSDVNGNPWNGDWEFSADQPDCDPKHQAYMFSTDDAYGMQACAADSTITVTLCSANSGGSSSGGSAPSESAPAPVAAVTNLLNAAAVAPSSSAAPAPAASSSSSSAGHFLNDNGANGALVDENNKVNTPPKPTSLVDPVDKKPAAAPAPTTLATKVSAAVHLPEGVAVVTEIDTVMATAVFTATALPPSRLARHIHHAHRHA